jgi:hypothetical protein
MSWLRLDDDLPFHAGFRRESATVKWAWVAALCLASKNDGILGHSITEAVESLADFSALSDARSADILESFLARARLFVAETGEVCVSDWSDYQRASDSSAERTRRYRARLSGAVTPCDGHGDGHGDGLRTYERTNVTNVENDPPSPSEISATDIPTEAVGRWPQFWFGRGDAKLDPDAYIRKAAEALGVAAIRLPAFDRLMTRVCLSRAADCKPAMKPCQDCVRQAKERIDYWSTKDYGRRMTADKAFTWLTEEEKP